MRPAENIEKSIKKLQVAPSAQMHERTLNDALKAQEKWRNTRVALPESSPWRIIMRSRMTKIVAAAAIIIAVLVGIHQFGGSIDVESVAFADVVRPLLTAETGSFRMTIDLASAGIDWVDYGDQPFQTIEVVFAGPSLTRWNLPTGEVLVANFEQGKVMILMPAKNQAAVMQVGPPGVVPAYNRFNQLLAIRPLIEHGLATEDDSVEFLGEREIDGITAIGYHVVGPAHHGDMTVWADVETKLPVWIERDMKRQRQRVTISDIAYDVEPDESLFGVEPPEGYVVATPDEAQPEFVVTGTVTDAATGEPIAGAKVSDDGYGPEPYRGAVTDSQGGYRYATWAEEHTIVAKAPGYKPQRKGLTGLFHTEPGKEAIMNFALERD